jgi:penicillin-binding protein-related factor A (putative recombinase)
MFKYYAKSFSKKWGTPCELSVSDISKHGHNHARDDNEAKGFFREKNRLNISVFKSDVIAGEIKELSQKMKQSDKLFHNTQIKLKHSAY